MFVYGNERSSSVNFIFTRMWREANHQYLHRDQNEVDSTLKAIGLLKIYNIQMKPLGKILGGVDGGGRLIPCFSPYPFQHQYCHREDPDHRQKRLIPSFHQLSGVPRPHPLVTFQNKMSLQSHSWTADHVVQGAVVCPAAAYVEMGFESLETTALKNIHIGRAMLIPNESNIYRTVRQVITNSSTNNAGDSGDNSNGANSQSIIKIYSKLNEWDQGPWICHVTATKTTPTVMSISSTSSPPLSSSSLSSDSVSPGVLLPSWTSGLRDRCLSSFSSKLVYDRFRSVGLTYGPLFQCIDTLHQGDQEAFAVMNLQGISSHPTATQYILHPALLDSCFQVLLGTVRYFHQPYVPTFIKRIEWFGIPAETRESNQLASTGSSSPPSAPRLSRTLPDQLYVYARSALLDNAIEGEIVICDEKNRVLGIVEGVKCTALGAKQIQQPTAVANWQSYQINEIYSQNITTEQWKRAFQRFGNKKTEATAYSAVDPARSDPEIDVLSYESLLDSACVSYLSAFFSSDRLSAKPLSNSVSSWPVHRQRFWRWCQQQVAQAQSIQPDAIQKLKQFPDTWKMEVEAIHRVGSNLKELLQDQFAVQRIFFGEGDPFMSDLYTQSVTFQPFLDLLASQIVSTLSSFPPHRVIRILELGAGEWSLDHEDSLSSL